MCLDKLVDLSYSVVLLFHLFLNQSVNTEMDPFLQLLLLIGHQQALLDVQLNVLLMRRRRRAARRDRRFWVRPWLSVDRRLQFGSFDQLMEELRVEDTTAYFNYLRMEPAMFDELVQRLSPMLTKQDTNYRKALV